MRRLLCLVGIHDWDIVFPYEDHESYSLRFVMQEKCKCCGKKGETF